jgi:hypothetical protein
VVRGLRDLVDGRAHKELGIRGDFLGSGGGGGKGGEGGMSENYANGQFIL